MIDLPAWTPLEAAWMRTLSAAVLLVWPAAVTKTAEQPVGLLRALPASTVERVGRTMRHRRTSALRIVLAALFIGELATPLPAIGLATATLLVVTLQCSDGSVNHGHHLSAIVAITYAAADTARWLSRELQVDWDVDHATAASWTVQAIVALYLTSGAAKVVNSGGGWMARTANLQLAAAAKSYQTDAGASKGTTLIHLMTRFPRLFPLLVAGGLVVEVLTPVALLHPVALFAVGVALLTLHALNGFLLDLPFPQYQALVAIHLVAFSLPLT